MNTKNLQFANHTDSNLEIPALPAAGFIRKLLQRLGTLINGEKSSRFCRSQPARNDSRQDILHSLPTEEKLRLGMYHFMN